jgi:hypothetical protein
MKDEGGRNLISFWFIFGRGGTNELATSSPKVSPFSPFYLSTYLVVFSTKDLEMKRFGSMKLLRLYAYCSLVK